MLQSLKWNEFIHELISPKYSASAAQHQPKQERANEAVSAYDVNEYGRIYIHIEVTSNQA